MAANDRGRSHGIVEAALFRGAGEASRSSVTRRQTLGTGYLRGVGRGRCTNGMLSFQWTLRRRAAGLRGFDFAARGLSSSPPLFNGSLSFPMLGKALWERRAILKLRFTVSRLPSRTSRRRPDRRLVFAVGGALENHGAVELDDAGIGDGLGLDDELKGRTSFFENGGAFVPE